MFCSSWTGLQSESAISYCGGTINILEDCVFSFNIAIGLVIIYVMQNYMIGILDKRDALRDVDPPSLEPFVTISVMCSIVKTIVNRNNTDNLSR